MTLRIDVWPWKTIGHLFYTTSFQIHCWSQTWVTAWKRSSRVKIGDFFVLRDRENWRMTLKNNRAPLLCCFNIHASFHSQWWIQTWVTVRKFQFWWKSTIFLAVWLWNLTDDLEEQYGTSSKQHQALCIISSPYVNSNWSYGPETAKWGHDLCDLDIWPLTLTFCMVIVSVNGNNSWKFQDDTMTGTLSKRCARRTGRQTDGRTDGNKCS